MLICQGEDGEVPRPQRALVVTGVERHAATVARNDMLYQSLRRSMLKALFPMNQPSRTCSCRLLSCFFLLSASPSTKIVCTRRQLADKKLPPICWSFAKKKKKDGSKRDSKQPLLFIKVILLRRGTTTGRMSPKYLLNPAFVIRQRNI